MQESWKRSFMEHLEGLDDREYFRTRFSWALAEVTAGIKPANLLFLPHCLRSMAEGWHALGQDVAAGLGLETQLLAVQKNGIVALSYDRCKLSCHLKTKEVMAFLTENGIAWTPDSDPVGVVLTEFTRRYSQGTPHEIGVILGYGVENVQAFLQDPEAPCKLCRYWRVYTNPDQARQTFQLIDKARREAALNLMGITDSWTMVPASIKCSGP